MQTHQLQDRQDLNDLMNGWMHRDLGEWEQLRNLFHPDGTIEITWFEGLASDFVEGSMRMGASDLRTKHMRLVFWIVSVLLLGLLAVPWLAPLFYWGSSQKTENKAR